MQGGDPRGPMGGGAWWELGHRLFAEWRLRERESERDQEEVRGGNERAA